MQNNKCQLKIKFVLSGRQLLTAKSGP